MTDVNKPPKREAEKCPWYLLATLYGVPEPHDQKLLEKNRVAWNRFMATRLSDEQRAALMESKSFPKGELLTFLSPEMTDVETAFKHRGGTPESFSKLVTSPEIDFSNLELDTHSRFDHFLFPGVANFSGSNFTALARFEHAFFYHARFEKATFESARFNNATFNEFAGFDAATLTDALFNNTNFFASAFFAHVTFNTAAFDNATFKDIAHFNNATFKGTASFDNATFHNVIFNQATFAGETRFINSDMQGPTSFEGAIFEAEPPRFFGAKLHQGTNWHHVKWPPRPRNAEIAAKFVSAYEPLKLEMDRLKKHEDELDFFAREMQAREVMCGWQGTPALVAEVQRWLKTPGGWLKTAVRTVVAEVRRWLKTARMFFEGAAIALYGTLCDYGRSYLRPIIWLLGTIGVGALLFRQHFGFFHKALGFSFVNTFALLGLRKDFFAPSVLECLSNSLRVVAGLQTILGIVFLFLFGLALRNRFRMR